MRGLDWQPLHIPFAAGLNQKSDPRLLQPPFLSKCVDVQFDDVGGLQTRYPYSLMGSATTDDETISTARRVERNGDELLVFTKDTLYSWNARLGEFARRGTHLAVKVEEQPRFIQAGDQVDCDRAEMNGTIFYVWTEIVGVSSAGYIAAVDKATGGTRLAPFSLGNLVRCRLVTLSTKLLLTFTDGNTLYAMALDPDDPATALNGVATNLGACNAYYDITRVIGTDSAVYACRLSPTTSYRVGTVTAALVNSTSTKARTCDGPIAVASHPSGTHVQVVRGNSTNIQGDYILLSTLADVTTGQAIGTANSTVNQIAAAYRSVTDGGFYRCYAFWSDGQSDRPQLTGSWTRYNYVDTGNNLGTAAELARAVGVASRAFDHDGRVYVNVVFAGESDAVSSTNVYGQPALLQNTYFLYRDDAFLVAKQAMNIAGGYVYNTGHLPGVALTSGTTVYSWCGTERRIIPLGGDHKGYADRGPRDLTLTFDSNEARRVARIGETLYISGGEILQYDGRQLTELGFHYFPYFLDLSENLVSGNLVAGSYFYQPTYRWQNAKGEIDRSTSATIAGVTIASPPGGTIVSDLSPLNVTHKAGVAVELWRSLKNPVDDAPYYLVTSKDPGTVSGANCYIANSTTIGVLDAFNDYLEDADARDLEESPENGNVLENMAPPPATIIVANDTRLFLAGVAGDPHRVWYSKQRNAGEVAAFHESLTMNVPAEGGSITALGFLSETLVVFRESAIYILPGDGFDNTLGGANYGPARSISTDIGAVNHESVAATDRGLIFKSSKGWYLLNKGWSLEYIGGPVTDYDSETPLAVHVVESQHQVRILTSSRMLVLDTLVGQWGEWTIADGVHACIWDGAHVYLTTAGPKKQQTTYANLTYGIDVETAWIKLADLQGFGRVRRFEVLGEYRSAHRLRVRCARDYWSDGVDTYFDDDRWTPSPTTVGGPEQVEHSTAIQQMQAIKIRLTAIQTGSDSPPTGEALRLTGLSLEVGIKPGLTRHLPAAQKQ